MPIDTLSGKVAIVTGAAHGIGRAIARHFAAQGAHVMIADVASADLTDFPPETSAFVPCDVSQPRQVDNLVERTLDAFGRIDILVNNAALTGGSGSFLDVRLTDWQRYLDVNLTGAFLVGQAAARAMVAQSIAGRIINMGSVNSFSAEPGAAPYVSSKGGLHLLTKAMAVDLAAYGILVNMLAPGPIRVDRNAALFDAEPLRTGFTRSIPLAHTGEGQDIAAAAAFLASDACKFITGATLIIDGGLTALMRYD